MVNRRQRNAMKRQEAARRRLEFATRQQQAARGQLEAATRDLELATIQEQQANNWLALAPVHNSTGRVRGWLGRMVRWFEPAAGPRTPGQLQAPERQYILERIQRRREDRWQPVHNAAASTALTLYVVYVLGSLCMHAWYFVVDTEMVIVARGEFPNVRIINCSMPFNFDCLRMLYYSTYYY